jgi:hypothetical protein
MKNKKPKKADKNEIPSKLIGCGSEKKKNDRIQYADYC